VPQSVFQTSVVPLGLKSEPLGGALPARRSLNFTMQHQRQTQWCWAAVTSSVAAFFRNPLWTQCRVVNDGLGQAACCADGFSAACNRPWYLDKSLGRTGNLGAYSTGPLSLAQVRSELDAECPIGVRIGWAGGGGHFVAVGGYSDPQLVDVRDPWFGISVLDYTQFRTGYQGNGRWTHSYRTQPQGGQRAPATRQSAFQGI
jgi:hypothetical protein